MRKYNLIKVIALISILTFFFAQSAYDPSVHAKMQSIDDEDLSEINAKALDIDFTNFTVRAVVNDLFRLKDSQGYNATTSRYSSYDSIIIDKLEIGDGADPMGPANLSTTMSWDIGSQPTQTWLLGTNITFPAPGTGMSAVASNVYLGVNGTATTNGTRLFIANRLMIANVSVGQAMPSLTPALSPNWQSPFTAPWIIISSEGIVGGRGLEFYGEVAGYIEQIRLDWRTTAPTDATSLRANGLYVYGLMNDIPDTGGSASRALASGWSTRTGSLKLGGLYPTYNVTSGADQGAANAVFMYCSIDVGTRTTSVGLSSGVRLNLPFAGSIRLKNFHMGTRDFGPFALDDIVFYRSEVVFRDLNKL